MQFEIHSTISVNNFYPKIEENFFFFFKFRKTDNFGMNKMH